MQWRALTSQEVFRKKPKDYKAELPSNPVFNRSFITSFGVASIPRGVVRDQRVPSLLCVIGGFVRAKRRKTVPAKYFIAGFCVIEL